jgi:hypothetical protein
MNFLIKLPTIENSFCFNNYQFTDITELSLYIKNFILYLVKHNSKYAINKNKYENQIENINIKFTNNLQFFIDNNPDFNINLIFYFNTLKDSYDFKILFKYDYILFNLNNNKSNLENIKKSLITFYPNIYINYQITEEEDNDFIKLDEDLYLKISDINTNIFSHLLLNKIFINPYESLSNKINNYLTVCRHIRNENINNINNNYINNPNLRKFLFYQYNKQVNTDDIVSNIIKLNESKNLVDINLLKTTKISNINEDINYTVSVIESEIIELNKELEEVTLKSHKIDIQNKIEEKGKKINELLNQSTYSINNYINLIKNDKFSFDMRKTKFNLEIDNLDDNSFWSFNNFSYRIEIFKNYKFVLLIDHYKNNISLLNNFIEVYLSGAIPILVNNDTVNRHINNEVLKNLTINNEKSYEDILINYSYEYLYSAAEVTCKHNKYNINDYYLDLDNKERNFEKVLKENPLLTDIPNYLDINNYEPIVNLGKLLVNKIESSYETINYTSI